MKTLLILLLFFLPLTVFSQLKPDKFKHIGVGSSISEATFLTSQVLWENRGTSFRVSAAMVTCAGFGKEMFDSFNGGRFSWSDFGATLISGYVVSGINYLLFKPKKKKEDPFDLENDPLVKNK